LASRFFSEPWKVARQCDQFQVGRKVDALVHRFMKARSAVQSPRAVARFFFSSSGRIGRLFSTHSSREAPQRRNAA
jgi:hypothetical protein